MDGTFLRKDHTFNKAMFTEVMRLCEKQGKNFVVASGNQWRQIRSFFEGVEDKISIVGENGAVILHHNQIIDSIHFEPTLCQAVLDELKIINPIYLCSGVNYSYVLNHYPQSLKDLIALYARNITYVDEYRVGDDPILKIGIMCEKDQTHSIIDHIQSKFGDVEVHSSGLGSIDINPKGVNKGEGLQRLLKVMNQSLEECMAFGDGGNDVSMLKIVKEPKVMANAPQWMYQLGEVVPSNEEQGALTTILKELQRHE
jgi:FMN hydrolase / 5-amino-6-(5-phospho-D-ribitylamino)uracil phosphatase